jgi:hypothetical protein
MSEGLFCGSMEYCLATELGKIDKSDNRWLHTCVFFKDWYNSTNLLGRYKHERSDNPLMFALLFSSKGPALQNFVTVIERSFGTL